MFDKLSNETVWFIEEKKGNTNPVTSYSIILSKPHLIKHNWLFINWRIICLYLFCFKAYFISKLYFKENMKDDFLVCTISIYGYIYFNIKKCYTVLLMFLILGYFFVPLEDVKLRQLTRRRRLHNVVKLFLKEHYYFCTLVIFTIFSCT